MLWLIKLSLRQFSCFLASLPPHASLPPTSLRKQLLDVDLNWLEVDGEVVVEDDGAGDDDKWEVGE